MAHTAIESVRSNFPHLRLRGLQRLLAGGLLSIEERLSESGGIHLLELQESRLRLSLDRVQVPHDLLIRLGPFVVSSRALLAIQDPSRILGHLQFFYALGLFFLLFFDRLRQTLELDVFHEPLELGLVLEEADQSVPLVVGLVVLQNVVVIVVAEVGQDFHPRDLRLYML